MGLSQRQIFFVIMTAILTGNALAALIFLMSRQDPNLRVAALVGSSQVSISLIAIASTLSTGKDLTGRRNMDDLPPGSALQSTETLQTAPVNPQVIPGPVTSQTGTTL